MKKVIVLLAKAGSGKTTAADYLVEDRGAERISIAAPIKEMAQEIMGFTDSQVWGEDKDKECATHGMTPRHFLQELGRAGRQILGESVFMDVVVKRCLESPNNLIVIDDARYESDIIPLRSLGFRSDQPFSVKVVKLIYADRELRDGDDHISEQIDNVAPHWINTTLRHRRSENASDLKAKIDKLLREE